MLASGTSTCNTFNVSIAQMKSNASSMGAPKPDPAFSRKAQAFPGAFLLYALPVRQRKRNTLPIKRSKPDPALVTNIRFLPSNFTPAIASM